MRLLAWAALLVLPAMLAAQQPVQSVTGIVRDTAGAALGGAEVIVGARKATTSPSGQFRVDSLRPGQYAITIRLVGYNPVHSRVVVVASEPTEMEYFMLPAPYLLAPIVVETKRTGIYGAVGDTGYKAAVGARVIVSGTNGGEALTDSMGRFAFPEADRGVYMVRVTFPGYSERRFSVELKKGEGRELGVMLTRSPNQAQAVEEGVLEDLGHRLTAGLARERMTPRDLERHGSGGICNIQQIRTEAGRGPGATTILILNGTTVYWDFDVESLCAWRADEVELVEYSPDVCRDVTQTVVGILNASGPPMGKQIVCSGRTRLIPKSFKSSGTGVMHGSGRSYVIIWEKR